jgi:hypothetical protein
VVQFHSKKQTSLTKEKEKNHKTRKTREKKRRKHQTMKKREREIDHTCISSVQKGEESDQSPFHSIAPQGFLT